MTGEEIEDALRLIGKKAATLVNYLAQPQEANSFVYELARLPISHLVGRDALHDHEGYKTEAAYQKALNDVLHEIEAAAKEARGRYG